MKKDINKSPVFHPQFTAVSLTLSMFIGRKSISVRTQVSSTQCLRKKDVERDAVRGQHKELFLAATLNLAVRDALRLTDNSYYGCC